MPSPDALRAVQPRIEDSPQSTEASPLWGVVLALAEIAARVERRQAEEIAEIVVPGTSR
jgi:hypothetical protein